MDRFLSKDFWSGVMFTAAGIGALIVGGNLAVGTAIRMGPGYVPRMLSYILIALGIAIIVRAVLAPAERVDRFRFRPITLITIGVLAFAFLFERAGLAPALVALVFLAALGGQEFKLIETILACITLIALCTVIFKIGLQMNIYLIAGVW